VSDQPFLIGHCCLCSCNCPAKMSIAAPSSSSASPVAPLSFPKGRAKACTACRQVKLKCNSREVYPAPCSRCVKHRMECKMDSAFKRVPARRQLEDVSSRLSHLQRSLGLGQDDPLPGAPNTVYRTNSSLFLGDPEQLQEVQQRAESSRPSLYDPSPSSDEAGSASKWLHLEAPHDDGSWVIENVSLDTDTVLALFQHFDQHHWHHVQFLEACTSLRELYLSSPFLFWTIISTASRKTGNGPHTDVHDMLQPHVLAMLSARVMDPKLSIKALHAMLILCTWPFPVISQTHDSTWVLCGVVMNYAMLMGLHKPGHAGEYGRPLAVVEGDSYTKKMTWLAIFQISTR